MVDDQHGQPTWTLDLARILEALVTSGAPYGTYHATSSGETTWCGFAREIFSGLGLDPARVHPTSTDGVPAAGAATGVLRPRARRLAPRGHRPDPGLARGPGARLCRASWPPAE